MKYKDQSFSIYSEKHCSLHGKIQDGKLYIDSIVYGYEYDSEQHIELTKEETEKVFSLITLEELIELGKEDREIGIICFLEEHDIEFRTTTF